ncbi:unnamed protein product [Lampetra fluviatilis]
MEPVFSPDAVAAFVADQRDEQEESVLAAIGITATVLNLLVIIFVYIYNTASVTANGTSAEGPLKDDSHTRAELSNATIINQWRNY